ncbi:Phospholipase D beta 2 [Chionoecetes opilio]|uniref:phospholipase D n=1 Tax=Chionoecetes opilio TaxID=41210 RepID=A0A8J4XP99_CHIOP|nr:Phospholipase D beta 2 [Chionoecetes opilio]
MKFHGDLEVEVVSGENLADRDNFLFNVVRGDWSDVWVSVSLGSTPILVTGVRKDAINAVWGEHVTLPVCEAADYLDVTVWDKDPLRSQLVGKGRMQLGNPDQAWKKEGPVYLEKNKGRINMKIRYTPAVQARKEGIEVPRSYFPMHKGGTMTFYQDAHADKIPGMTGGNDGAFEAMAAAIRGAKKFIYISGWSLWTGTRLQRDGATLGEFLKQKASEGVRVLILIWNERFSAGVCAGLVGTFDEDTDRYFDKTGVHVEKVRRKLESNCKLKERVVETLWTHHQKVLVADDGVGDLVAFFGGLDLTLGRWDTPEHQLFTTLQKEHKNDFHNGFISVKADKGPREPWHDVHARLTGPAAIDLLRNFEDRWRRQVPVKAHLLVQTYEEDLLKAQEGKDTKEGTVWQMQVVRSIDGDSSDFNSSRVGVLNLENGHVVDTSVHQAFVRLIRKAEKFIYIESQYFIGSAKAWSQDQDAGSKNLVPLEIVQRLVSKIQAGEAFRVYLVVPLMPEGSVQNLVTRSSIKAILHYQFLTIQMMYKRIGEALREAGSDRHPSDYLLVLCLGKKESRARVHRALGGSEPREGSDEWAWRQKSRFLIYVHSKMAIADDAHIILGSANMNERSLDGARDTEVAVSAGQVQVSENNPQEVAVSDGDVAMFRRRLWAEHTSGLSEEEKALLDPSSLSAVRRIRDLADESMKLFVSDEPDVESKSRFMRYPLQVSKDGEVQPIDGIPTIPDFDIPVEGSKGILPPISVL